MNNEEQIQRLSEEIVDQIIEWSRLMLVRLEYKDLNRKIMKGMGKYIKENKINKYCDEVGQKCIKIIYRNIYNMMIDKIIDKLGIEYLKCYRYEEFIDIFEMDIL